MAEKRGYVRLYEEGSVHLKREGDSENIIKGDLINIAFLGFCVCLKEKIDIGTIVEFELTAEIREIPLLGKGRIRYVNEIKRKDGQDYQMGVEFTEVDRGDVAMLLNRVSNKICRDKRRKVRSDLSDAGIF